MKHGLVFTLVWSPSQETQLHPSSGRRWWALLGVQLLPGCGQSALGPRAQPLWCSAGPPCFPIPSFLLCCWGGFSAYLTRLDGGLREVGGPGVQKELARCGVTSGSEFVLPLSLIVSSHDLTYFFIQKLTHAFLRSLPSRLGRRARGRPLLAAASSRAAQRVSLFTPTPSVKQALLCTPPGWDPEVRPCTAFPRASRAHLWAPPCIPHPLQKARIAFPVLPPTQIFLTLQSWHTNQVSWFLCIISNFLPQLLKRGQTLFSSTPENLAHL